MSELAESRMLFFQDPYEHYRKTRDARLTWDKELDAWLVNQHADVELILKDRRFGKKLPKGAKVPTNPPKDRFSRGILNIDPPDHTRLRALFSKAFNARRMQDMRPNIEKLVSQLLDHRLNKSSMELKSEFAHPIPAQIISDMLGIPVKDHEMFAKLSNEIILYGNDLQFANEEKAEISCNTFDAYLSRLFKQKRKTPKDDLISALIETQETSDHLNEEELLHNIRLLFIAGHETTVNLICNALVALHKNPNQMKLLKKKPYLMPSAVEELLRFDSSVQRLPRIAQEDVILGKEKILQGQTVICMLGSANRDPSRYRDPETLNIERTQSKSTSFGGGIHFCIGAQLARLETEIAIGQLLSRLPNLKIDNLESLNYPPNPFFRGPDRLDATW